MSEQDEGRLNETEAVYDSSGNVFADLDLPHSEEDMIKVYIAHAISHTIAERKLTQKKAAEMLGVDQAKVSQLVRGHLKDFSVDRLLRYLPMLGLDVDIQIRTSSENARGRIKVLAA